MSWPSPRGHNYGMTNSFLMASEDRRSGDYYAARPATTFSPRSRLTSSAGRVPVPPSRSSRSARPLLFVAGSPPLIADGCPHNRTAGRRPPALKPTGHRPPRLESQARRVALRRLRRPVARGGQALGLWSPPAGTPPPRGKHDPKHRACDVDTVLRTGKPGGAGANERCGGAGRTRPTHGFTIVGHTVRTADGKPRRGVRCCSAAPSPRSRRPPAPLPPFHTADEGRTVGA